MQKKLKYNLIILVLILVGWCSQILVVNASPENPSEDCILDDGDNVVNAPCVINGVQEVRPGSYVLLAPINIEGGIVDFDPSETNALNTYLNLMIKLVIGISAVLAVVMIVIGGIEYMTSELVHSKEAGKEKITNALLGLMIALGAYALLYTINPDLVDGDVGIKNIQIRLEVTKDQENFARTEQLASATGTKYTLNGSPSAGVTDFITNQLNNRPLRAITVDTSTNRAYFYVGAANDWTQFVSVPINVGQGGVASQSQAQAGDLKTPRGTTVISGDIRIGTNGNAVISNGGYNLGAAFININTRDANGNDRGIGFHGSANNNMGTTNGCIRMSNDDLIALGPYMRSGVQVIVK